LRPGGRLRPQQRHSAQDRKPSHEMGSRPIDR
jgi:hypothetical protein